MVRRLRLASGLVLFTYVTTHLLNHALGLVSVQVAEAGRLWFTGFWRHPLGSTLLYAGLATHLALVLWAIYQRRHFRLPRWEIIRLVLGLLIPILLFQHIARTRLAHEVFGVQDTYTRQMLSYWVLDPATGAQQLALLTIAWMHGCLGIHYWWRVKLWYRSLVPALRLLGPLVPVLALFGYVAMGKELQSQAADPFWLRQAYSPLAAASAAQVDIWRYGAVAAWLAVVGAVFGARRLRRVWEQRRGAVRITYPDGRQVRIAPGMTLLEVSRASGIPHTSLCGGRGRCSTCRTRIGVGLDALPPPSADEARVLRRIGAPPNVRLACQIRPTADMQVFPLLPPHVEPVDSPLRHTYAQGAEQVLAIMFVDLRAYSRLAERQLPYDVVFLLNQYFAAVGEAVERAGGHLDKFIGDGAMAWFGLQSGPAQGCREALRAAAAIGEALDRLNYALQGDLREPLRLGIGVHVGQVIVGHLGYGRTRTLTAVGDAVNIASRLEELTKEYGCQLVLSADVAAHAGVCLDHHLTFEVTVRGRETPLVIHAVPSATILAADLAARSRTAAPAGPPHGPLRHPHLAETGRDA